MIKLVIWDLDETLWRGTLADAHDVALHAHRAALIRRLNDHGVVSSICSKNDFDAARARLEQFGLWDQFVFPRIAFVPKAEAVAGIIADMQLRAADVLFVDDNIHNLEEARFRLPDLQTLDISAEGSDAALNAIFAQQPASRNRIADYRRLEHMQADRAAAPALSDEDFLRDCDLRVCMVPMMANLDHVDRIVELVNRSNQLNYTQSRVDRESLVHEMIDGYLRHHCWSVFAWDKYGAHGLVGFAMLNRRTRKFAHFVFSCRIMHLGVEAHVLDQIGERIDLTIPEEWRDRIGPRKVDWIKVLDHKAPQTLQALSATLGRDMPPDRQIRIMHACQSGGLAHYSVHRDIIDFDISPRNFALHQVLTELDETAEFPPFLVYGASIDYKDENWPGLADRLDPIFFNSVVYRFCEILMRRDIRALVLLPPENLSPNKYGPKGLTLERTIVFNGIWVQAAEIFPCLTVLEVESVCMPDDFVDVNHLRPSAAQPLAMLIDAWYGYASGAGSERLDHAA